MSHKPRSLFDFFARRGALGPARLGPARLGPARLGPARLGPARLGPARLGLAVVSALTLLGAGCEIKSGRNGSGVVDSESHWLDRCVDDATCGDLNCLCGVCSLPCAEDNACTGISAAARCAPDACGAAGLCTATCTVPADCAASGLTCADGACVPEPGLGDGGLGDGGLGDGGLSDGGPSDGGSGDAGVSLPNCTAPGSTCQDDTACGPDQACAAPSPGGVCACIDRPARQRAECPAGACCTDAECAGGGDLGAACVFEFTSRQQVACGGIAPGPDNVCLTDVCRADADCGPALACIRPGQYGFVVATCVPAHCATDADCTAHPGGRCTAFLVPCRNAGLWCTYDEDPCRTDADCPQRGGERVCLPREGGPTECVPEGTPPP